jgi:hypothetical protein
MKLSALRWVLKEQGSNAVQNNTQIIYTAIIY